MDAHPLADRAQPAPGPEPPVAGRLTGPSRHGRGRVASPASGATARSRGAGQAGRRSQASRGRASEGGSGAQDGHTRQRPRHSPKRRILVGRWQLRGSGWADWARRGPERCVAKPSGQWHRTRSPAWTSKRGELRRTSIAHVGILHLRHAQPLTRSYVARHGWFQPETTQLTPSGRNGPMEHQEHSTGGSHQTVRTVWRAVDV